jgi:hypothetical protein
MAAPPTSQYGKVEATAWNCGFSTNPLGQTGVPPEWREKLIHALLLNCFIFNKYFVRGNINDTNGKEQKFDSSRNVVNVEKESNIV